MWCAVHHCPRGRDRVLCSTEIGDSPGGYPAAVHYRRFHHNLTIGIKEHTIFPETSDEDLKDVLGLAITIVTTASTKAEAEAFLRHLGLPLIVDSSVKR